VKSANCSLHNSQIYKVNHKIDFFSGDVMCMKNLVGDIVFLNPDFSYYTNPKDHGNNKDFSVFNHTKQNLLKLIAKAFCISNKIALKLPGFTNIDELSELFHLSLKESRM